MRVKLAQASAWQKVLYKKQKYPDNYVDQSFLDELRKNHGVQTYSYKTLVNASTVITQQLSSVAIFIAMHLYMKDHSVSAQTLWLIMSTLSVIGYIANFILNNSAGQRLSFTLIVKHLKTSLLFQGCSAALSPVLVSLTETISTDTIYTMTTSMLLANLLLFNYDTSHDAVPGAMSFSAAIFSSVCLASRLHTPWHAFTTVTSAFELFALWPSLRKNIKEKYPMIHQCVTVVIVLLCMACLGSKTLVGAVIYCALVLLITFACTALFHFLQSLKNNISGPWDEAVIHSSSVLMAEHSTS
ncbi:phosphatidylinositol N-acetylglucosaminyltransferase subunit C [Biomphalaria glabrata]|nr:phosphatidylinositol N-acetylglucosaminyltransferase subunit C-like [Biomphalaria glabrata]